MSRLYTVERVQSIWTAVAFSDSRKFAFLQRCGKRWLHPNIYFPTHEHLFKYIEMNNVSDVHVKPLDNCGGREWVIDVDVDETENSEMLQLKIDVAVETFKNFFGSNIARIMHSGNRGVHVWLKIDKFRMSADKKFRNKYYNVMIPPKTLTIHFDHNPGSFVECLRRAITENEKISQRVQLYFKEEPLHVTIIKLWPFVDRHVFCNNNQIRAPFSYNRKGLKFSHQLY